MPQHLLFVVHGIGQHEDFHDDPFKAWNGEEGTASVGDGGNFAFRGMLEALQRGRLEHAPATSRCGR